LLQSCCLMTSSVTWCSSSSSGCGAYRRCTRLVGRAALTSRTRPLNPPGCRLQFETLATNLTTKTKKTTLFRPHGTLINNHQTNMVNGRISDHYCHLVKSQVIFRKSVSTPYFGWGFNPKSLLFVGQGSAHTWHNVSLESRSPEVYVQYLLSWHLNSSKGLSKVHDYDRRQIDRRTALRRNVCE